MRRRRVSSAATYPSARNGANGLRGVNQLPRAPPDTGGTPVHAAAPDPACRQTGTATANHTNRSRAGRQVPVLRGRSGRIGRNVRRRAVAAARCDSVSVLATALARALSLDRARLARVVDTVMLDERSGRVIKVICISDPHVNHPAGKERLG